MHIMNNGFPNGLVDKESACNAGDTGDVGGLIPGLGRSPGDGHGNPLQYSCLENCQRSLAGYVHGVAKSWTRLSD